MKLVLPLCALLLSGAALPQGSAPSAIGDLQFDGVAQPSRLIHLGAATDGLLKEVRVDRGDMVQAGQVLALLDIAVSEAQAALARARVAETSSREIITARLIDVRRRLARQEELLAEGFTTPEEVDATRTELRIEELNLAQDAEQRVIDELERERSQAVLDQGTLTSPIDGIVTERFLSPGEILSKSGQAEVLTIAQLDPLHVELNVPVDLYDQITVGQRAAVQLDAPGEPQRKARVLVKDHLVDTASRTFRVRLALPNHEYRLPAGLRCRINFDD